MCALFVPLSVPVEAVSEGPTAADDGWSVARAEELLTSLTGVVSVRIVADKSGSVDEVHLLTTDEIGPKQTVRNVESALLAHLGIEVDHRKISVAQQAQAPAEPVQADPSPEDKEPQVDEALVSQPAAFGEPRLVSSLPAPATERRILFTGHQVDSERSHRVRMQVAVEWNGQRFMGAAEGTDLPRPRMEAVANAALRAVESAVAPDVLERRGRSFNLALDGVQRIEAFDKNYVLVSVHALNGTEITPLSGTASVRESSDRAVILATLKATDRWVRGRL